jgi:hypothetical protein
LRLSRSRIRRFLQTLAVEDKRILFKLAVWKFSHPLFNVYYIFEFDLARAHELSPALLPAGITIRLFRGEREISPVATLLVEAGLYCRDRRATDDWKLAAYAWATFTGVWIPELCAGLPLRSDEAVRFDTLVMPRWRGRGLHYPLTVPVLRYLSEQGYRRTLVWVNALNTRSLKNQRWRGNRKIATIVSSPLLGLFHLRNVSPEADITVQKKKPSLTTQRLGQALMDRQLTELTGARETCLCLMIGSPCCRGDVGSKWRAGGMRALSILRVAAQPALDLRGVASLPVGAHREAKRAAGASGPQVSFRRYPPEHRACGLPGVLPTYPPQKCEVRLVRIPHHPT